MPRLINAVCDKALLYGYVNGTYELKAARGRPGDPRAGRGGRLSLIDDALKRAQAAGGGEAQAGEPPVDLRRRCPTRGSRGGGRIVRWRGHSRRGRCTARSGRCMAVSPGARVRPRPLPAGEGRGEGRPAGGARPAADRHARRRRARDTHRRRAAAHRAAPRTAAPTPGDTEAETEAVEPAPAASPPRRAPQAVADGKTYAGSVALPGGAKIELGGIVWSETEPRALLNDRIAARGRARRGLQLTKIEENRVALEKDGVTIYISVK